MGSKRIGLARTQALIENLKRELNLNGATLKDVEVQLETENLVEASIATKVILASESGGVIELHRSAGSDVVLPDNATVGMRYTVIVRTELSSGKYEIEAGSGNTFSTTSYIIQKDKTDASVAHALVRPNDDEDVKLTMTHHGGNKTALFGTVYEIVCVSAGKWRITGTHHVDGAGTAVFS